ncbi:hypothetical protein L195_g058194 [Trifolium pratense]|uniref:Uncharacterized protein n=1 Tax=Trifolium pratense TaxID=57577 RepID=A0A2K3JQV2_TRIPR|nr:hypothetical protein L195_g058194 [Trifolium pratense]
MVLGQENCCLSPFFNLPSKKQLGQDKKVVTFCFVERSGREENGGVTSVREEVEEETELDGGSCR